jgi:hypothetical protein
MSYLPFKAQSDLCSLSFQFLLDFLKMGTKKDLLIFFRMLIFQKTKKPLNMAVKTPLALADEVS